MPSNSAWSSCALATQSCCRCCALLRDERPALGSYMSGTVPEQHAARTAVGKVTMHCLVSGSLLRRNRSSEELVRNRPVRDRRRFLRRRLRCGQRGRKFSSCRCVRDRDGRSSRGRREPVVQRVLFDDCKDQVHKSILSNSEAELWSKRCSCEAGDQARQDQTLVTDHCTAFPPGVCTSVESADIM